MTTFIRISHSKIQLNWFTTRHKLQTTSTVKVFETKEPHSKKERKKERNNNRNLKGFLWKLYQICNVEKEKIIRQQYYREATTPIFHTSTSSQDIRILIHSPKIIRFKDRSLEVFTKSRQKRKESTLVFWPLWVQPINGKRVSSSPRAFR